MRSVKVAKEHRIGSQFFTLSVGLNGEHYCVHIPVVRDKVPKAHPGGDNDASSILYLLETTRRI
jgi:hypothetical protein